jgi:hypothetical protein
MRRAMVLAAAAVFATAPVGAYQWPVESPVPVATFGQGDAGRLGVGVELVGSAPAVRPIAGGEVVFWFDPGQRPSSLPRGLGAHVVVQHPEKVRSVYAHLEASSVAATGAVAATTVIGRVGDTGAALGPALGLSIMDMETASYLNPLMVLPPLVDHQPPVIARVLLRRDGVDTELGARTETVQGAAELLVEAYDLREDVTFRWRLAPYSAALAVNGRQVATMVLDSLRVGADGVVDSAGRGWSALYAGPWLIDLGRIQVQGGETHIQVFVRDFAGNESSRELYLRAGT